jgi:hypothetical protein
MAIGPLMAPFPINIWVAIKYLFNQNFSTNEEQLKCSSIKITYNKGKGKGKAIPLQA